MAQWQVAIRVTESTKKDPLNQPTRRVSPLRDPPSIQVDCSNPSIPLLLVHKYPFRHSAQQYAFDRVFDKTVSDAEVYAAIIQPLVEKVCCGHSATVFFHGTTWANTQMPHDGRSSRKRPPPFVVLIKRACDNLIKQYKTIDSNGTGKIKHRIHVSIVETFASKVVDRVSTSNKSIYRPNAPLNSSFSTLPTQKGVVNSSREVVDLLSSVFGGDQVSYRPSTAGSTGSCQSFSSVGRSSSKPLQRATSLVVTLGVAGHTSVERAEPNDDRTPSMSFNSTELRFVLLASAEQPEVGLVRKNSSASSEHVTQRSAATQKRISKSSYSAHSDAHTYTIDKDIAQSLDSLIRCVANNGIGHRESALTHYLGSSFTDHKQCVFMGSVNSSTFDYSKTLATVNLASKILNASRSQFPSAIVSGNQTAQERQLVNPLFDPSNLDLVSTKTDVWSFSSSPSSDGTSVGPNSLNQLEAVDDESEVKTSPIVLQRMDRMLDSSRKVLKEQIQNSVAHDLGYTNLLEMEEANIGLQQSEERKGDSSDLDDDSKQSKMTRKTQSVVVSELHRRTHELSSDLANERLQKRTMEQTIQELKDKLWTGEESWRKEIQTQDQMLTEMKRDTTTKIDNLSKQLEAKTNACDALESENEILKSQLTTEHHSALVALEAERTTIRDLERENEKLRKEREAAKSIAARLQNELEDDSEHHRREQEKRSIVQRITRDLEDRAGVLIRRIDPDDTWEAVVSVLANRIVELVQSHNQIKEKYSTAVTELKRTKVELDTAVKTIEQARIAQRTSNNNAKLNLERIATLKQAALETDEQVMSTKKTNQLLIAQVSQLKSELHDSQQEAARLRELWKASQIRATKSERALEQATALNVQKTRRGTDFVESYLAGAEDETILPSTSVHVTHQENKDSNKLRHRGEDSIPRQPLSPFANRVRREIDSSVRRQHADIVPSFRHSGRGRSTARERYQQVDNHPETTRRRGYSFGSHATVESGAALDPLINAIIDATAARTAENLQLAEPDARRRRGRRLGSLPRSRRHYHSNSEYSDE